MKLSKHYRKKFKEMYGIKISEHKFSIYQEPITVFMRINDDLKITEGRNAIEFENNSACITLFKSGGTAIVTIF